MMTIKAGPRNTICDFFKMIDDVLKMWSANLYTMVLYL